MAECARFAGPIRPQSPPLNLERRDDGFSSRIKRVSEGWDCRPKLDPALPPL